MAHHKKQATTQNAWFCIFCVYSILRFDATAMHLIIIFIASCAFTPFCRQNPVHPGSGLALHSFRQPGVNIRYNTD
jgi:hypothetical protein